MLVDYLSSMYFIILRCYRCSPRIETFCSGSGSTKNIRLRRPVIYYPFPRVYTSGMESRLMGRAADSCTGALRMQPSLSHQPSWSRIFFGGIISLCNTSNTPMGLIPLILINPNSSLKLDLHGTVHSICWQCPLWDEMFVNNAHEKS